MTRPLGLLLSCFDYSPVAADEFHDWYDTEHIPERKRVPGFLDCRRWLGADRNAVSVTTYDLSSIGVLRSPGYLAIGYENNSAWTRRVGWRCIKLVRMEAEQIVPGNQMPPPGAGALLIRAINLESVFATEVAGWFAAHAASLAAVPGFQCGRLFHAAAGTHQYAALYHFDALENATSPEWRELSEAPWNASVAPHARDNVDLLASHYVRTAA